MLTLLAAFVMFGAGFGQSGGNPASLGCQFAESGLTTATETVSCAADATVVWHCRNRPDVTTTTQLAVRRTFPVAAGQATGVLPPLGPPARAAGCPQPVLASVSYAHVTLTGSSGDTALFRTVAADGMTIVDSVFGPVNG